MGEARLTPPDDEEERRKQRRAMRLALALSNLPWLLMLIGWLWWKSRH